MKGMLIAMLCAELLALGACAHPHPYPPPLVPGAFESLEAPVSTAAVVNFSIPAGRADRTLVLFQEESGIRLEVTMGDLTKMQTSRISGRVEPREALQEMLEDTPLRVQMDDGRRIVLGVDSPDTVY